MSKKMYRTKKLNDIVSELVEEASKLGDVVHYPISDEEQGEATKNEFIAYKLVAIAAVNQLTKGDFDYIKRQLVKHNIIL